MAYEFALNPIKLQRAIKLAKTDEENAVLEAYISLGGKVNTESVKPVKEPKQNNQPKQPKQGNVDEDKLEELKQKGWKL